MLSEALEKTAQEFMRQSQNGTKSMNLLAERVCALLKIAALHAGERPGARLDVDQLRCDLSPFIPEFCILDAIVGHIFSILDGENLRHEPIEKSLFSLLEEVRDAEYEMGEQLATLFNPGDNVIVLAEREGGYIEAALKDAVDGMVEDDSSIAMKVSVLSPLPDHEGLGTAMSARLDALKGMEATNIPDALVTKVMQKCNKVVLAAIALDVDDGSLCYPGSALICSAANRLKVPVVIAMPKHRILPLGSNSITLMSRTKKPPGMIWEYQQARDDRDRDPISVIAPAYDVIQHQRCEMVVTEFGGFATEYVRAFAPSSSIPEAEEEQE